MQLPYVLHPVITRQSVAMGRMFPRRFNSVIEAAVEEAYIGGQAARRLDEGLLLAATTCRQEHPWHTCFISITSAPYPCNHPINICTSNNNSHSTNITHRALQLTSDAIAGLTVGVVAGDVGGMETPRVRRMSDSLQYLTLT
jgi:hypothetical protein